MNRLDQFRRYINQHEEEMLQDLKELVCIPSELKDPEPGMPFGAPAAAAVQKASEQKKRYGFSVTNYDNYVVAADFGTEEKYLDILAHLDVVPAGEGWQVTEPFVPVIRDGKIYGRGTSDDKGPAIAALYAMRMLKELGFSLQKNVRLILGSDEECGSRDLVYYYQKEKKACCTFSPDAAFPVINIEKGGLHGNFSRHFTDSTCTEKTEAGMKLLSVKAGIKLNVIPEKAYAVISGTTAEELHPFIRAAEEETQICFQTEEKSVGIICITACGKSGHAADPAGGNNALTGMLLLISRLPLEDRILHDAFTFLSNAYPHGDYYGKALGVAMEDDLSGQLTLSLTLFSYDGKTISGSFDCRAPLCATNENLRDIILAKMETGSFQMDGKSMYEGHHVPADSPFVQKLLSCYTDVTGKPGKPLAIGGGTYVHHLKNGVAFGCGGEVDNHAHGADEFMEIEHLKLCAVIFAEAILRICG